MDWSIFLFASKWAFIALIYFILFLLLVTVRREFGQRIHSRPPQSPAVARLRVVQSGNGKINSGTVFDLPADATLGAAPDNQVVLADPYVSGHHARLRWDGANWWLEDLGSRNGTLVGGKRAVPYQAESLRAGTDIQIGDTVLRVMD
jgi:pSer/pThr/pTyr-binding forkhead associated (FHA) protein